MQMIREANLADAMAIAMVQVDSWRTTYAGIVPQEYLDAFRMSKAPPYGATFFPPPHRYNSSMLPNAMGEVLLASRRAAK